MKNVIMVVEDEFQIRKDLELILNLNNYECISAENGEEALQMLQNITPDIIISDIMMPKLNGFGLLKELQSRNHLATIPFLFLTAKIDRQDFREGMKLGADDFITKPFNFVELLEAIETRLKKKEQTEKKIQDTFEDLKVSIRYSLPHEIRNPLNIILGFSDLLKNNFEKTSTQEAKDMLDHIHTACMRLNGMFEKYLMMANLEMLSKNPLDLEKKLLEKTLSTEILISDIARHVAIANERSADLVLNLQDSAIFMDEDFFTKIIEEVLENGFKFSKNGQQVNVDTKIEQKFLVLEFKDLGRGMKPEQISRIGEYIQFERRLYEQQGIGLGLSIVKKLVDLHKGILKIESIVNEFTKVIIKLPRVLES